MIPRFELHLDAVVPNSEDVISPVALTEVLDEFEARLTALGAAVTIQLARTTQTELPVSQDPAAVFRQAARVKIRPPQTSDLDVHRADLRQWPDTSKLRRGPSAPPRSL